MSAGREFEVDGAATEKARRASSVCMRGTTSVGAQEAFRFLSNVTQFLDCFFFANYHNFKLLTFSNSMNFVGNLLVFPAVKEF